MSAGVYQGDEGKDINVRGGRTNDATYFVDGVKVVGNPIFHNNPLTIASDYGRGAGKLW